MPLNYDSFRNNENSQTVDILNKISQGDKSDLLGIQANDYLSKIKNMIGIQLDTSETNRIDGDFKESLKEMIVINNNQITDDYLSYLSYIYFALYNDTLAVYDELKQKNVEIDYYMLDKQFYNSIAEIKIEWEKYDKDQRKFLKMAYEYGFFDYAWDLIEINPKFCVHPNIGLKYLMENNFKEIIDTFDKKMLAQSELLVFSTVTLQDNEIKQEWISYLKELYKINPNIDFSGSIYDDLVTLGTIKDALSLEEVANLTCSQQYHIENLANEHGYLKDTKIASIKYYYDILKINPDYKIGYEGRECIEYICSKKIQFLPDVFMQLTEQEIDRLYCKLRYLGPFPELQDCIKVNKILRGFVDKYSVSEDSKVLKKECKLKWRR